MQAITTPPILEMKGITKRFPGLVALNGVDFAVQSGEIHALIGQNGAGKSTLMKILAGVYPIEGGEIRINGQPVSFRHPREALRMGIGTVYQDLGLVPQLSVADNIFLGREPGNGFVIDEGAVLKKTEDVLNHFGVRHIRPTTRTGTLPLAQQQLVEIAKVLSHEPRILVLDEPTAPLAEEETALLLNLLRGLREKGIAIIFISHRFKEILQHCDRATILRNGQVVTTINVQGVSEATLIELTIGERIDTFFHHDQPGSTAQADVVLDVENLSVGRSVRGVSFALRRGKIVGITGLLGAGQNELARALFGIQPGVSGTIRCNGRTVNIASPEQAVSLGVGLLTEQRKREGLILDMSVKENITLASLPFFNRLALFVDNLREQHAARDFIQKLNIVTSSPRTKVGTLSGGNQQKTILAKWLLRDLDILIFIAPTQGIDVGAKAEIYQHLNDLARQGKCIVVVSEDLIEILGVSDRIFVMYKGRLTRIFDRAEASEETLLAAIQGAGDDA
ncbi:MAG: sugar ABC transporter ATP-binding protein [Anaerolineae bacterium]|nr:sugar ABC transporter ATP-binding protein [Anaerolineae bacterium]